MRYSLYKSSRTWGINACAILLCLLLFPYQCDSYTEVFSVTKDTAENIYFVGNRDSDFFIVKKNSFCALQWESTAGSTSGDDNGDGNSEVFHDVVVGQDGDVYAVGSTHGSFTSPSNEVPNLDAAVVVYDSSSGAVIMQKQYDIAADLDNVAQAISQKANGNLLVAVYGSVPNIESTATYETRILEIDSETLEVEKVHEIVVTTTENVFSITGGPKLLDFIYEESTNSIIALGHILGRGLLWKYSFDSETTSDQVEWGEAFGNFQISAFTSDGNGAYYVVGSSSEQVLGNSDLRTTVSAEYHAYVVRFDNLGSSNVSPTWIRQLAGSGSSQSGSDIDIDPVTGEIVVVGEYDADFTVTDVQTSRTFSLNLSTDDGITDVFLWYLDASTGDFKELRSSSVASTNSEDRGNAISVLSRRTVQIGGITNDGDDAASTACDTTNTLQSPTPSSTPSSSVTPSPTSSSSVTPSPTPSSSVTPSPTPSTSSSSSSSSSPSQTVSPSMSSSESGVLSDTSSPSPSRSILSSGSSDTPSSSPFASGISTNEANTSPSPLTSRLFPSSSSSPIILQVSASKTPSHSITPNPSETTKSSFVGQISQIASLDISESTADPSRAAVLASVSGSIDSSRDPVSQEFLSVTLQETGQSSAFVDPDVSADPAIEDGFETIASTAPTAVISDQEDSMTSSNEGTSLVVAVETEEIGTGDEVTEEFQVSRSQEVPASDELVIDVEGTPSENKRDISAAESPQASSNAILVSFMSATPSFSSSPHPSHSALIIQTAIISPNLEMTDDPSVPVSSFDITPQSTPPLIPTVSFTFVSVDLGTPTPSSSPSIFTNFPSDSLSEAPSTTFDFITVDLGVSFSPSTSSVHNAVDVNFISPTPSSSKTALMVSLETITPQRSAEPSSASELDGEAESSFTPESSLGPPAESSDLQKIPSNQTPAPEKTLTPDDDDLAAQISIIPTEESELFPSDVATRSIEAFPTALGASIEPSLTPQPMFTMSQTNDDEEEMMKSNLPMADSGVDEATVSPLLMQVGELAVMSPPELGIDVTPLVSEVTELPGAASSPKIQDIGPSTEAEFTSDPLNMPRATPDDMDGILATVTELAQFEMSPRMTVFDVSTEPFQYQPENTIIFAGDDDSDEKDIATSALPTLESRFEEVKESPISTKAESTRSTTTQEFTFAVTPGLPESQSSLVRESPNLFERSHEPGLRVLETSQVAAETLFLDIPSSPQGEITSKDFLQSPEPSQAFEKNFVLAPSDYSNAFTDGASFVIFSPDSKSQQEIQPSESAPEPSNLISSEFFTPIVSSQATEESRDNEAASTQSNFLQQTMSSAEVSFPIESMEGFVGSISPAETIKSSSEENGENEILQASVEDGQNVRDSRPSATFSDVHTDDEEVFATELAGSSQTPIASSEAMEESGAEDIPERDAPRGPFIPITTSETVPVPSKNTEDEFGSPISASLSASSEFTSPQDLADTGLSPTFSLEDLQFTGIAKPEASFDFEQQIGRSTPEFSAQVTVVATISSSLEPVTEIPSASRTKNPVGSFVKVPSQSQIPDAQQREPSNVFVVSETPMLPSEQYLSASIDASSEFTPQGNTENVPFASADAQIQIRETPGAGASTGGVFSQEPDEGIRTEPSVAPDEIPVGTNQITTPAPTSELLTKTPMDASRTPVAADFTPGLAASILVDSPESEDPMSSRSFTPPVAESSLVSASVSITLTPKPSKSENMETPTPTPTPTTTQVIPREPAFSFIDIVFPSATPSSSPTVRTGTVTASPTADVNTVSISPIVSPVSSPGSVPISPSVAIGSRSSTPFVSSNPSDAVLIVLPSATPSSSLAVLIVLPSATPSSSLLVTGSDPVKPSLTATESQRGESSSPISTGTFSPTLIENPENSNLLHSPFASQGAVTPKASPSSADRGFLTITPSSQGLETPVISKTPLPAESTNFSQAPVSSAIASLTPTEISLVPSAGSPAISPLGSSQASITATEGPTPSLSNQPLTQETPVETVPVSIIPPSITTPSQNLSTPSSMGSPTREPLQSAQPSSLETPVFKPSVSSLPSFVGDATETSSVSSQPLAQGNSVSASPSIPGNTMGFASRTFLMEPSVFQGVDFSLLPSAEGNSEEPTASLLPTQRIEPATVSSDSVDKTEEPSVAEEIIVQSPAISHEMDDREEETSVTPPVNPSFSEEVEASTVPSSAPSPSGILMASVQPTASSSGEASPTTSVSVRSSPSPIGACIGDESIIVDPDSLNRTRNFQRVNMVIQVAGPNLTGSCQFTGVIAERFILLSAINTLSQADMWHITSIENGPPVLDEESALVGIEDEDSLQVDTTVISPSPSSNITRRIRFEGSVIFNVTAFMDSLSVELASGSYVEYINSQNIVKVMTAEGFNDIKWTGMISAPRVIDVQAQEEDTRVGSGGLTSGEISAVAIGMLLIVGVAGFVIVEGGITTRRSGAILPI